MAKVIEPLKNEIKLTDYFRLFPRTNRVLIIFWHGLGDLIMFLNPYRRLKLMHPGIHFDLAVQKGLSFEDIVPGAISITGDDMQKLEQMDYDVVAKVHFPMNEGQTEYTKGEWCCLHELGISPTAGHRPLQRAKNRLCGLHFHITCLPDACNPDKATAQQIWQEVLDAGWIPIETHFEHVFHNPVNTKFDFIDCSVRKAQARISTLVGLIQSLGAFIGVVSGNFHVALATLPSTRVMLLEKHFKLECFSHLQVARASILEGKYPKGMVKKWLTEKVDTLT